MHDVVAGESVTATCSNFFLCKTDADCAVYSSGRCPIGACLRLRY